MAAKNVLQYLEEKRMEETPLLKTFLEKQERLNERESRKYLGFVQVLKQELGITDFLTVRSFNNFPKSCGLASSASSFAALTKAVVTFSGKNLSLEEMALLSRRGSGSSCRSFFEPWALWNENSIKAIDLGSDWLHQVVIVDQSEKKVSSSQAHDRVRTSQLFEGRKERVERRLEDFLQAIETKNWTMAFHVSWNEFWDMHALFETAQPSFGYMTPKTLEVLNVLRRYWEKEGVGPLVTMDAGANIHLLYRPEWVDHQQKVGKALSSFSVLS
ncbi:MAG: diphosphomevalonate decarboxylase [Bdellovibrionales bacterium]